MKNSSQDGRTLSDLIETALAGSAVAGAASAPEPEGQTAEIAHAAEAAGPGSHLSTVVVGEVLDTHHPHLPGRVLVRWLDHQGILLDRWIQRERHLSLRKADRVLLTLPAGWREWVVTGALGRESSEPTGELENAENAENVSNVRLGPGEALRILSHEGQPLMTLRQGPEGPIVELGEGNVELAASRTLRLSADTIEIVSAAGGTDLRTEGDTVVRARTIRLN